MNDKTLEALVKIVTIIVLWSLLIWAASALWNWHFVIEFGVPRLEFIDAVLVSLFIRLIR